MWPPLLPGWSCHNKWSHKRGGLSSGEYLIFILNCESGAWLWQSRNGVGGVAWQRGGSHNGGTTAHKLFGKQGGVQLEIVADKSFAKQSIWHICSWWLMLQLLLSLPRNWNPREMAKTCATDCSTNRNRGNPIHVSKSDGYNKDSRRERYWMSTHWAGFLKLQEHYTSNANTIRSWS